MALPLKTTIVGLEPTTLSPLCGGPLKSLRLRGYQQTLVSERSMSAPHSIVLQNFFGVTTKFFRTADAFRTRRYEGPHRFTQKRPRSFAPALRSIAVAESPHRLPIGSNVLHGLPITNPMPLLSAPIFGMDPWNKKTRSNEQLCIDDAILALYGTINKNRWS